MFVLIYLFIYISILRCNTDENEPTVIKLSEHLFPFEFEFGAGTSAYQTDGAWNVQEKVVNIWDTFVHKHPEKIADNSTGDTACNTYNLYKEDIQLAKELGVNYYHFSIGWSRLFVDDDVAMTNQYGLLYYKDVIDNLLRSRIKPRVTIYYWDLPQKLQNRGGWTNPETISYFVKYARSLFEHFGDKVKIWTTFSRPFQICKFGYGLGIHAPGGQRSGIDDYKCCHNILKAHAEVYHLYDTEFRFVQKGEVGISLDTLWYEAATDKPEDVKAVTRAFEFHLGIFANPIFGTGDYPKLVKEMIYKNGLRNNNQSRLPEFTAEEIAKIRGSADFFGLIYFSAAKIKNQIYESKVRTWDADSGIKISFDGIWQTSAFKFIRSAAYGIRQTLKKITESYNVSKIYITENGYPDSGGLADYNRTNYILLHLSQTLEAIHADKIPVSSYTVWSLIDQFEWNFGYTLKYGLFSVNFSNTRRERGIKLSSRIYTSVIKERHLPRTTLNRNSSHRYFSKFVVLVVLTSFLNIFK